MSWGWEPAWGTLCLSGGLTSSCQEALKTTPTEGCITFSSSSSAGMALLKRWTSTSR